MTDHKHHTFDHTAKARRIFRVIVAGSRDFGERHREALRTGMTFDSIITNPDYKLGTEILDKVLSRFITNSAYSIEIVSGTAKGADTFGERYFYQKLVEKSIGRHHLLCRMPAHWDKHGRAAGHIRNADMATYIMEPREDPYDRGVLKDTIDKEGKPLYACIVFWDGKSKGSKGMMDICKKRGIPLRVYNYVEGRFV